MLHIPANRAIVARNNPSTDGKSSGLTRAFVFRIADIDRAFFAGSAIAA
ncbi:MAG TPA: hypothetical protein VGF44_03855 [Terriglobales bacterium]